MKSKIKKMLGLFVFCAAVIPFTNVSAATYTEQDLTNLNNTPITSEDTFTVGGSTYIGTDGALTINSGNIVFSITNDRIVMNINGDVTLNSGQNFFIKVPDALSAMTSGMGFALVINNGSTLNINGTVIIPAGSGGNTNGLVTNNGTVNVNGTVELRSAGSYSGTGTTNVNGNFVVYGINGTNLNSNIILQNTGSIYADSDVVSKVSAGVNGMQITDKANKDYDSVTASVVTANGNNTFAYAYELSPVQETMTPEQTPTTDTTEEVKKEEMKNPETSDNILVYGALALAGLGVITVTSRKLLKH